jgi:hypothetical protein
VRLLADKMEFVKGQPKANYKYRLLMMLDEFPSLGKLEILQEALAFIAGYGIKCYLICQDINQLKSRETGYGHDESNNDVLRATSTTSHPSLTAIFVTIALNRRFTLLRTTAFPSLRPATMPYRFTPILLGTALSTTKLLTKALPSEKTVSNSFLPLSRAAFFITRPP